MGSGVRGVRGYGWAVVRMVDRCLPLSVRRRVRYYRFHHRLLSLAAPRTFTEKVQWRMLYDRRALLAPTCDKLAMKEYAAATGVPGLRVPVTYWSGTDLVELAGVELPHRWVLKPNHRFGLVELGTGRPDVAALRARTAGWLAEPRSARGEWAYSRARRCLLVEEMIGEQPPVNYKFWVFDGVPRLVQVDTDRFGAHHHRLYTPQWDFAGGAVNVPTGGPVPRPQRLEEMLAIASKLGSGFDMIRVDLYDVAGQTWFGELTPYPGSGMQRMTGDIDAQMGAHWHLPTAA